MEVKYRLLRGFVISFVLSSFVLALNITSTTPYTLPNTAINEDVNVLVDGATLITPGSYTINGNLNIINRSRVNINVAAGTTLIINGNVNIIGSGNSFPGVTITGGSTLEIAGNIYMKNTQISGFAVPIVSLTDQKGPGVVTNVTLEKVYLQGSNRAIEIANVNLLARFCKFESTGNGLGNDTMRFSSSVAGLRAPVAEFCHFTKGSNNNSNHIYASGSSLGSLLRGSIEGSYFTTNGTNGVQPKFNNNAAPHIDSSPLSTGGNPLAANSSLALVFSSDGIDLNFDKVIPPGARLNIGSGGLTIPSGVTLNLGWTEEGSGSYAGNAHIYTAANQNITINGSIRSNGPANQTNHLDASSSGKWGSLVLEPGSVANIQNTTILNATVGIIDRTTGTGTIVQNNIFDNTNTTANRISSGAGNYSNNKYQTNQAGIEITGGTPSIADNILGDAGFRLRAPITVTGGSPNIVRNTLNYASAGYGVLVSGGTPKFNRNTITGTGGTAIRLTGGTPQFTENNLSGFATAVDASNGTYTMERNFWGKNLDVLDDTKFFTGSGSIDYEPWLSAYPNTVSPMKKPFSTSELGTVSPENGSYPLSRITGVTFNIADLGYHNGGVLQYRLQVATNRDFNNPIDTNFIGAYPGQGATVYHPLSGLSEGDTYYWRVQARNTADIQNVSDYGDSTDDLQPPQPSKFYWFEITEPHITLTVTANKTQANAGEMVINTVAFHNPETSIATNVTISAILADEVYSNGVITLSGTSSMGNVTIRAYESLSGGAPLATYTANTTATPWTIDINNATSGWPQTNNYRIKRLELVIQQLSSGQRGAMSYRTIVK